MAPSKQNKSTNKKSPGNNQRSQAGQSQGSPISGIQTIRDPCVGNAGEATSSNVFTTHATDRDTNWRVFLSPLGMKTLPRSSNTGNVSDMIFVENPHLPWLLSAARVWEEFRILSASFEFVPTAGSGVTGTMTITSSRDPADKFDAGTTNSLAGNTKVHPLSRTSGFTVPLEVDNRWKPVSLTLVRHMQVQGFTLGAAVPVHSLNELVFTAVELQAQNCDPAKQIGLMYVNYRVQFRGPRASGGAN